MERKRYSGACSINYRRATRPDSSGLATITTTDFFSVSASRARSAGRPKAQPAHTTGGFLSMRLAATIPGAKPNFSLEATNEDPQCSHPSSVAVCACQKALNSIKETLWKLPIIFAFWHGSFVDSSASPPRARRKSLRCGLAEPKPVWNSVGKCIMTRVQRHPCLKSNVAPTCGLGPPSPPTWPAATAC